MSFYKICDDDVKRLRDRIGQPITRVTPPFYTELNVDAARHFAWAIGDNNPLWTEPTYGATTRWRSHLCPPCELWAENQNSDLSVKGSAEVELPSG